jgi:G3E family GTPase
VTPDRPSVPASVPPPRPGTPVVMISGVDDLATASAAMAWQWDLPGSVAVSHRIDPERQQLHRTIVDLTGVLEREVIELKHACVGCAIREDIVPTLLRLGELGRWSAIIAHLPLSAEAGHVCRALAEEDAPEVWVAGVVAALHGPSLVETMSGDALLAELGRESSPEDRRGLAEAAAAIVEYADVVALTGAPASDGLALLHAVARPDVLLVADGEATPVVAFLRGVHDHRRSYDWASSIRRGPQPEVDDAQVWRLDLRSDRPFHPERFRERLGIIGSGAHRSRRCCWLPTRPGQARVW